LFSDGVNIAGTRAVGLAAADEDRGAAIAVTSRTAALLATELLAGAGNVRPLASGAGHAAAVGELPGDDAVQDVGAGLDTEHGVVELDLAARPCVEGLDFDLHRLAFRALVGGRSSVRHLSVVVLGSAGISCGGDP
jgi:hypothetical protein